MARCISFGLIWVLIFTFSCGHSQKLSSLQINCEPKDALLFVNDKYHGTVSKLSLIKLKQGSHRIEFRREGYFAHFAEISLGEKSAKLVVKLRKEPF